MRQCNWGQFCMNRAGKIVRIDPAAGIPFGEVAIECASFDTSDPTLCGVWFDDERAPLVALSPKRVLAVVPDLKKSGAAEVTLESNGERSSPASFVTGKRIAEDLHPVTNPAFDPDDGSLFVTRSGSRGEQLPVSLFRIDLNGEISEFSGDITNPTGIAFDREGQMFVTSRLDGTVYRVTPFKEVVPFARNLGVATGIAFDRDGRMYVGDRSGIVYKVDGIGDGKIWAQPEPSVSAYHLAFGPDNALYVTGPTVSSFDAITRIDEDGEPPECYRWLWRPQGLAFDSEGNLYVAASLRGRRGIIRISPDAAQAEIVVAGMNLVGLAFSAKGEMIVATNEAVYSLPLGIYGTLVD